jgi:hypothetical protein
MGRYISLLAALTALPALVQSITVADIQGSAFLSPYNGQTVHNLTGIVTAKVSAPLFQHVPFLTKLIP